MILLKLCSLCLLYLVKNGQVVVEQARLHPTTMLLQQHGNMSEMNVIGAQRETAEVDYQVLVCASIGLLLLASSCEAMVLRCGV